METRTDHCRSAAIIAPPLRQNAESSKDIRKCSRETRHKSNPFMLLTSTIKGVKQEKKHKDMLENRKSLSEPLFFYKKIEFLSNKPKILFWQKYRLLTRCLRCMIYHARVI